VNGGYEYRVQVGAEAAGWTVLRFLASRYRHSSAETWSARLAAGEVRVGEDVARAERLLRPGDRLVWARPPWAEPEVPLAFGLLHRDAHLLAVAKPAGLPSVPNGGFLEHTLLHRVRRLHPEAVPLHRLGRGTSGLVLFARTEEARRRLASDWRRGEVDKHYLALVRGVPARDRFSVDVPIGPVAHPRLGTVHAAVTAGEGRPSRSHVRVLERRADGAVVEVRIETGRPHQIRIHLAAAGHPLVGDPLYQPGGRPSPTADPALPGDLGYRLHAYRLAFRHPATGEPVAVECGAPPDLRPRTGEEPVRP
jgi:23S rRNA pseudouridine1911/1915/1917 synthase